MDFPKMRNVFPIDLLRPPLFRKQDLKLTRLEKKGHRLAQTSPRPKIWEKCKRWNVLLPGIAQSMRLSNYNIITDIMKIKPFDQNSCMWPLIIFIYGTVNGGRRRQKLAWMKGKPLRPKKTGEADAIFLAKQVPSSAPPERLISISM